MPFTPTEAEVLAARAELLKELARGPANKVKPVSITMSRTWLRRFRSLSDAHLFCPPVEDEEHATFEGVPVKRYALGNCVTVLWSNGNPVSVTIGPEMI